MRGLTRRSLRWFPLRWLHSPTTIWTAPGGARGDSVCLGTRLQSYSRPVRAGLFLPALMESARPAPHPVCGLYAPERPSGLAGRGLTCVPSHRLVPCATFSREPPPVRVPCSVAAAFRRAGQRSSGRTPGHGPTRPRPCAPSCARAPRRRYSPGDVWPAATAIGSAPSRG